MIRCIWKVNFVWLYHSSQALSAVLLEANRRYGLRTSGLQFLFWSILLILGIPQLRTQFRYRHQYEKEDIDTSLGQYHFWSYLIFFVVSLIIWFLNCYADREPEQTKYPKSKTPYPEQGSSFLSRLFYAWFDPLVISVSILLKKNWFNFHLHLKFTESFFNRHGKDSATH